MANVKLVLELEVDGESPAAPTLTKVFEALAIPVVRGMKVVGIGPAKCADLVEVRGSEVAS